MQYLSWFMLQTFVINCPHSKSTFSKCAAFSFETFLSLSKTSQSTAWVGGNPPVLENGVFDLTPLGSGILDSGFSCFYSSCVDQDFVGHILFTITNNPRPIRGQIYWSLAGILHLSRSCRCHSRRITSQVWWCSTHWSKLRQYFWSESNSNDLLHA